MKQALKFQPFSRKQRMVFNWWTSKSPVKGANGIIADGSVRSGKTLSMSLSFVLWAMANYDGEDFIMAGKTIGSFQRNVLKTLVLMLQSVGFRTEYRRTDKLLAVTRGQVANHFYIFGGKDEQSQDLVQGMTAAGAFFDEVALMPESFVAQATARCSVDGAKLWFNCNPAGPLHWFKIKWLDKHSDLGLVYLHFTMEDNLSLTAATRERYASMYTGVFYLRYIKGLWAVAEGLIYSMFDGDCIYDEAPVGTLHISRRTIACDYGTTNPCVFLDIYDDGSVLWIENEYRWDSKSAEAQRLPTPNKTDAQYADDMRAFMTDDPERQCQIVVDPSAKSFITELRQRGFWVKEGDNEVLDGIRKTASLIGQRKIMVNSRCRGLISEMQSYVWDDKANQRGEEQPVKMLDHGPDALRYYVNTCLPDWRTSF